MARYRGVLSSLTSKNLSRQQHLMDEFAALAREVGGDPEEVSALLKSSFTEEITEENEQEAGDLETPGTHCTTPATPATPSTPGAFHIAGFRDGGSREVKEREENVVDEDERGWWNAIQNDRQAIYKAQRQTIRLIHAAVVRRPSAVGSTRCPMCAAGIMRPCCPKCGAWPAEEAPTAGTARKGFALGSLLALASPFGDPDCVDARCAPRGHDPRVRDRASDPLARALASGKALLSQDVDSVPMCEPLLSNDVDEAMARRHRISVEEPAIEPDSDSLNLSMITPCGGSCPVTPIC